LLLIAPTLDGGLSLHLEGKITSIPYIKMTLALLENLGVQTSFKGNTIKVQSFKNEVFKTFTIESDWSSASYFYSLVALSPVQTQIDLTSYKSHSLQGDACNLITYQKLFHLHEESARAFKINVKKEQDLIKLEVLTIK
jgi:3-phosphoshikimate 1-carboxyvinyltransferase